MDRSRWPASLPGIGRLVRMAIEEDLGTGDITTDPLIPPEALGEAEIRAKAPLVLAGLEVARMVFRVLDPTVVFTPLRGDGDQLDDGDTICRVSGRMRTLLTGERTALNFLQRLSGVATHVRRHVEILSGRPVRLVDTRKTTPGWRVLEKYAVRVGGASNHRMNLSDGVLIKDNHIAACGGIAPAVQRAREACGHLQRIEVEAADMRQVREALQSGADIIMLDNMDLDGIREAVDLIAGRALVEVSGGVTRDRLSALAATGVDIISCGALTHSAVAVDISMSIKAAGRKH